MVEEGEGENATNIARKGGGRGKERGVGFSRRWEGERDKGPTARRRLFLIDVGVGRKVDKRRKKEEKLPIGRHRHKIVTKRIYVGYLCACRKQRRTLRA